MLKKLFRFDTPQLFTLYTAAMLPLHVWVIYLFLSDFGWIAARSTAGGALGVGAYALAITLAESLLVFLILIILGWLLPAAYSPHKRIAILALAAWLPLAWSVWTQSAALNAWTLPQPWFDFIVQTGRPVLYTFFSLALPALATVAPPILWLARSHTAGPKLTDFIRRLQPLAWLYLFLDVVAIVVVIFRNL